MSLSDMALQESERLHGECRFLPQGRERERLMRLESLLAACAAALDGLRKESGSVLSSS